MSVREVTAVSISPQPSQAATGTATGVSRDTFRALLASGRQLDTQDPGVIRESAAQFMAELFFVPLLSEMRQFPFGHELASGGQTEEIFGQQLDQRIADQVASADSDLLGRLMDTLKREPGLSIEDIRHANTQTPSTIQPGTARGDV